MNRASLFTAVALFASAGALAGCTSSVTCEDRDDCGTNAGGASATSSTATTSTASVQATTSTASQGGSNPSGTGGGSYSTTTVGGGGPGAPNALLEEGATAKLYIATFPLTCADPGAAPYGQCGWGSIDIKFPGAMIAAGSIDFNDPSVTVYVSETGSPNSSEPGDCSGSGAISGGDDGIVDGTVTFGPSTETSTQITVKGLGGALIDANVDGTYPAQRCGG